MRNDISIDRIANSIIQRRKRYNNFILVEGSHDRLFFLKFKDENTQIEITFGWEKLISIISRLKELGFEKVIGIVDKDLRQIIPEELKTEENVIVTDEHDINIICIEKSFETIFQSYCSAEKVDKFKSNKKIDCLKNYTHGIIRPLSYLKVLNKRENLNLSFKGNDSSKKNIDYSKFIDKQNYEFISLDKLVETITNYSRNRTEKTILTNKAIVEKLTNLIQKESYVNPDLNCGHDFGEIICLGLKKVLGTKEIEGELFLKETLLVYETSDFITTNIFKQIKYLENKQSTEYLRKSIKIPSKN
ncbi:hypothetical protein [Flavobacterium sp. FlaQc-50]|jgi:hypothetical protein|uniref:hypothetical protein n=1 Tax=unclassified Flavobacterium TaxID=196869 RepID=UPI003757855A